MTDLADHPMDIQDEESVDVRFLDLSIPRVRLKPILEHDYKAAMAAMTHARLVLSLAGRDDLAQSLFEAQQVFDRRKTPR